MIRFSISYSMWKALSEEDKHNIVRKETGLKNKTQIENLSKLINEKLINKKSWEVIVEISEDSGRIIERKLSDILYG